MKIEFAIEIKPGTARRIAVVGVTLLIVGGAVSVYADQIQFSSGQTLTAADLNNNFNELYAKTAKPIATLDGNQISVNGVLCGETAPVTGNIGGYRAAKLLCETQCGSPTAHMCAAEEAVRTAQLGGTPAQAGWISIGDVANINGFWLNDCAGWSNDTDLLRGTFFYEGASTDPCDLTRPILCCD